MNAPSPNAPQNHRYRETRRVTLVGAAVDLVLGIGKVTGGIIGQSQALVADGVHSLSDLVTDALVVWAARKGNEAADQEHPYGHGRIETVTTVLLGIALILVALGIAWDAAVRLTDPAGLAAPGLSAAGIAAVSILAKEWIYHYTRRVARRIDSPLLLANAWHSRSDALSSVVVLAGILGAAAGVPLLDPVAAIIVAAMIVHMGWRLGRDSVHELIDTGLDRAALEKIRAVMLAVDGVRDVHELRTRRMGPQVLADVHVIVAPGISVSEGHRISEEVERAVADTLDQPMDVIVHIDCEEDQLGPPVLLPLRGELAPGLERDWAAASTLPIAHMTLHYLDQAVDVEIEVEPVPGLELADVAAMEARMRAAVAGRAEIGSVRVLVAATADDDGGP